MLYGAKYESPETFPLYNVTTYLFIIFINVECFKNVIFTAFGGLRVELRLFSKAIN